jgi:hypothetical protein
MCRCTWLFYPPGPGRQATRPTTLAFQDPSFQVPQVLPSSISAMPRTTRCRRYGEPPQPGQARTTSQPHSSSQHSIHQIQAPVHEPSPGPLSILPNSPSIDDMAISPTSTSQFRVQLSPLPRYLCILVPAPNTHDTNPTLLTEHGIFLSWPGRRRPQSGSVLSTHTLPRFVPPWRVEPHSRTNLNLETPHRRPQIVHPPTLYSYRAELILARSGPPLTCSRRMQLSQDTLQ